MVGMTVIAVGRKGYDHLWFDPADVRGDPADDFNMVRFIHVTINVIQEVEPAHSQCLDGILQFFRADLGESLPAGILLLGTKPASLPT